MHNGQPVDILCVVNTQHNNNRQRIHDPATGTFFMQTATAHALLVPAYCIQHARAAANIAAQAQLQKVITTIQCH
jgi:hypothetical protein